MKKTKWFLTRLSLIVVFTIFSFSLTGCSKDDVTSVGKTAAVKTETKPVDTKPEVTNSVDGIIRISIGDLAAAVDNNILKATTLYQDKTIETTGFLNSIDQGTGDNIGVVLDDDKELKRSIYLTFTDKSEIAKVAELDKGQEITVIGTGVLARQNGRDVITLRNCKIK